MNCAVDGPATKHAVATDVSCFPTFKTPLCHNMVDKAANSCLLTMILFWNLIEFEVKLRHLYQLTHYAV